MKNKIKKIIIVLCILIFAIVFLGFIYMRFLSLDTKKYFYEDKKITLEIPKYSFFLEEKNDVLIFKSLHNKNNIDFILKKLENKYQKYTCRHETYYYDKENEVTIIATNIKSNSFFNEIHIKYKTGKYDNNYCNKVIDPTKIDYQFRSYMEGEEPRPFDFKSIEKNGETITIHYNNLSGRILLKTGNGNMNYLESMIQHKWLTMNDVVEFLEHKARQNEIEKSENNDIGYTIYITKDFSLVKCKNKPKDMYIENFDFVYEEHYCK